MNTKYLVPLCATVALLAACSQHKDTAPPSVERDSLPAGDTAPANPPPPSGQQ